jgi:hypothetical protein
MVCQNNPPSHHLDEKTDARLCWASKRNRAIAFGGSLSAADLSNPEPLTFRDAAILGRTFAKVLCELQKRRETTEDALKAFVQHSAGGGI